MSTPARIRRSASIALSGGRAAVGVPESADAVEVEPADAAQRAEPREHEAHVA